MLNTIVPQLTSEENSGYLPIFPVGSKHGAWEVVSLNLDDATDYDPSELVYDDQVWVYKCKCLCGTLRTHRGDIKSLRCNHCRSVEIRFQCDLCGRYWNSQHADSKCPYSHDGLFEVFLLGIWELLDELHRPIRDIPSAIEAHNRYAVARTNIRALLSQAA
jgi:hypothetical protein